MTLSVSIDDYIKRYEEEKAALELKEQESAVKYAELLTSLEKAFAGVPFKFRVTDEIQGRKWDGSAMCYGKTVARELSKTIKQQGILRVVVNELPQITKIMALVQEEGVAPRIDAKLQVEAMSKLLQGFVDYCQGDEAPSRIIRKGQFAPIHANLQPQPQNAPRANVRTPRPHVPRPAGNQTGRIGGRYKANSAIGIIYQRMEDGQEHDKRDLFAGLSACESGKDAPFNRILRHVANAGGRIEINGSKVTMVQGLRP